MLMGTKRGLSQVDICPDEEAQDPEPIFLDVPPEPPYAVCYFPIRSLQPPPDGYPFGRGMVLGEGLAFIFFIPGVKLVVHLIVIGRLRSGGHVPLWFRIMHPVHLHEGVGRGCAPPRAYTGTIVIGR